MVVDHIQLGPQVTDLSTSDDFVKEKVLPELCTSFQVPSSVQTTSFTGSQSKAGSGQ